MDRDIWSHKTSETLFLFVIFSILDWVQQKVNDLLTSPNNQFRDYHTWNRIEKLMPQHWNFAPQTLKTLQKTTNLFSNLNFLPKSGFPKTRDFPWIFHGGRRPTRNLKTYCCNMFGWFGEVWGTRKNHTHRCVSSFYYLAERKVRKKRQNHFSSF